MAEEPNMIEIESTGNRTLDMYLTSLPAFLKAILDVIPQLDEKSQDILWDAIGATCFHVNRKIREKESGPYPTDLTMEEAVAFLNKNEQSRENLKREFYKEVDGKQALVREREYHASWDGSKFEADSGIGRLYGNICTCLLKSCGLVEMNENLCQKCQQAMYAEAIRFLTDGKQPEHVYFESPENVCNGCDHCRAVFYYPPEKQEHVDF